MSQKGFKAFLSQWGATSKNISISHGKTHSKHYKSCSFAGDDWLQYINITFFVKEIESLRAGNHNIFVMQASRVNSLVCKKETALFSLWGICNIPWCWSCWFFIHLPSINTFCTRSIKTVYHEIKSVSYLALKL